LVALVTPMDADGTVNIECLRNLIEWHIENLTDGIVVLGSTGEAMTLNPGEHHLVIEQTLEQVRGRVPVIAGTGSNSTSTSIHMTKIAMEQGVDACLVVAPYYNKPTQEGLYQHFTAIAEAVPVPLILYNVPSRTACDLKPETIARLSSLPNIVGVKEATGEINRVNEILSQSIQTLDLLSGDDLSAKDFMLAGGKGVISVVANVAPKLMHELCVAALEDDKERAAMIDDKLAGLHKNLFIESNPIPVKWALHEMGLIPEGIRLPLTPLSKQHQELVRTALHAAGCA
jgi:4-hydroxy-tetrahydrodipicolinate synthase